MSKAELAKAFATCGNAPKYIFGRTKYASEVCKHVSVSGFVDETSGDTFFEGLPIIHSLAKLPAGALVLNGVVEGAAWAVEEKLAEWGGAHIDYFALVKYGGLPLSIEYWSGFADSYGARRDEFETIRNLLADELSKQTFDHLVRFKLNHDISEMAGFKMKLEEQYFEPFLGLEEKGESFCDVGGFDGATTVNFIKHCPQYEKVYYWEPEPGAMVASKAALGRFPRIGYIPLGASDKKQTVHFKKDGSASKISGNGDISISVSRIDDEIQERVTFIKMDIEGSEVAAIHGARDTILRYHPKLAVCAYHKGDDFIQIPKAVWEIRNDYNVFLRHYTQGVFETVMFFMPRK